MGADLTVEEDDTETLEPTGRVTARFSELSATDVAPEEVPGLIDELPLFLLAAAAARGSSRVYGAEELRVKESDRLSAMTRLLSNLGVSVVEYPDGLQVDGDPGGWQGWHGAGRRRPPSCYGGSHRRLRLSEEWQSTTSTAWQCLSPVSSTHSADWARAGPPEV